MEIIALFLPILFWDWLLGSHFFQFSSRGTCIQRHVNPQAHLTLPTQIAKYNIVVFSFRITTLRFVSRGIRDLQIAKYFFCSANIWRSQKLREMNRIVLYLAHVIKTTKFTNSESPIFCLLAWSTVGQDTLQFINWNHATFSNSF